MAEVLTAAEQRRLRCWRAVNLGAGLVALAGLAAIVFVWPGLPMWAWLALLLGSAVATFPLNIQASRCPRCGGNLYVPKGVSSFASEWDEDGGPLPNRCRVCGVGLVAGAADAASGTSC